MRLPSSPCEIHFIIRTVCNGVLSEEHNSDASCLRGESGRMTYGATNSRLPHLDLFEHTQDLSKA